MIGGEAVAGTGVCLAGGRSDARKTAAGREGIESYSGPSQALLLAPALICARSLMSRPKGAVRDCEMRGEKRGVDMTAHEKAMLRLRGMIVMLAGIAVISWSLGPL